MNPEIRERDPGGDASPEAVAQTFGLRKLAFMLAAALPLSACDGGCTQTQEPEPLPPAGGEQTQSEELTLELTLPQVNHPPILEERPDLTLEQLQEIENQDAKEHGREPMVLEEGMFQSEKNKPPEPSNEPVAEDPFEEK
jgi:hypothetical protein